MSEAEDALAIVVGDCAQARHAHVAGNEHSGDRFAWVAVHSANRWQASDPKAAGRAALHGRDAHLLEHGSELAKTFSLKPENTSGVSIGTIRGACRGRFGDAPAATACASSSPGTSICAPRLELAGGLGVRRPALVEVVDFEHQLDRRDAADRIGEKTLMRRATAPISLPSM